MNDQPIIDPKQVHETQFLEHTRQLLGCRFSPCGRFVFAGGVDNLVHRWELESGQHTAIPSHGSWVAALAFHPDGQRLITSDYIGCLRCWNYADEKPVSVWSLDDAHAAAIRAVSISADGKYIATTGHDRTVRVSSTTDGKALHEFAGHSSPAFAIAFHPDSKSVVSAEQFGVIKHWDVATGKHVRDIDGGALWTDASLNGGAHTCGIRCLRFDATGDVLASGGLTELTDGDRRGGDASILLLNWSDGSRKDLLAAKKAGYVENMVFHPTGAVIAACLTQENGSVQFWQAGNNAPVHQFKAPGRDIDLHPDGERFAVCEWKLHGKAGNNASTEELVPFKSHHGAIRIHSLTPAPAAVQKA
jgi:WD40 repeat protein